MNLVQNEKPRQGRYDDLDFCLADNTYPDPRLDLEGRKNICGRLNQAVRKKYVLRSEYWKMLASKKFGSISFHLLNLHSAHFFVHDFSHDDNLQ